MGLGNVLLRRMEEGGEKLMILARQGYQPGVPGSGGGGGGGGEGGVFERFDADNTGAWMNIGGTGGIAVQGGALYPVATSGTDNEFTYLTDIPAQKAGRVFMKQSFTTPGSYHGVSGSIHIIIGMGGLTVGFGFFVIFGGFAQILAPDNSGNNFAAHGVDLTTQEDWWFAYDLSEDGLTATGSIWSAEPPAEGYNTDCLNTIAATGSVDAFGVTPVFGVFGGGGTPRSGTPDLADVHYDDFFTTVGGGGSAPFEYDDLEWVEDAEIFFNDEEAEATGVTDDILPTHNIISFERSIADSTVFGSASGLEFDRHTDNVDFYLPRSGLAAKRLLVVYDWTGVDEYTSITPSYSDGDPNNEQWFDGIGLETYGFVESYYPDDGSITFVQSGLHVNPSPEHTVGWMSEEDQLDFSYFVANSLDYPEVMVIDVDWEDTRADEAAATGYYVFYEAEIHVPLGMIPPVPKFYFLFSDGEIPPVHEFNTVLTLLEEPEPGSSFGTVVKGGEALPVDYNITAFDFAEDGETALYTHKSYEHPQGGVHRMDPDGNNEHDTLKNSDEFSINRDCTKVAMIRQADPPFESSEFGILLHGDQIHVHDYADGVISDSFVVVAEAEAKLLFFLPNEEDLASRNRLRMTNDAWSPDGTRIVYWEEAAEGGGVDS